MTARPGPDGVYVIDKSKGPTSHGVVMRLRRALGTKAIGHAGTLDPMATGVLVITVGEATKLAGYLLTDDKEYETVIVFGEATETLDAEGKERTTAPVPASLREALDAVERGEPSALLEAAIQSERERTKQSPPVYSALKVDGQRAYARARAGKDVDLPDRDVAVRSMTVVGATTTPRPTLRVRMHVGKGYYVRAFGRDLALALGTIGHLDELRRTASGRFRVGDAVRDDAAPELIQAARIPLEEAARRALPTMVLPPEAATHARFGREMDAALVEGAVSSEGPHVLFDEDGTLLAIGAVTLGRLSILRGFVTSPQ